MDCYCSARYPDDSHVICMVVNAFSIAENAFRLPDTSVLPCGSTDVCVW